MHVAVQKILASHAVHFAEFGHLLEIAAGTKSTTGTGDDDDLDSLISFGLLKCCAPSIHHLKIEGIELIGPVEGQGRNAVGINRKQDGRNDGHGKPF